MKTMQDNGILASAMSLALVFAVMASGCGDKAAPSAASVSTPPPNADTQSGSGPDTSGLGETVLGKINADPTRQDMKVTGKLLEFNIVSANADAVGGVASAVVECAGVAEFDGDVEWGMSGQKKAGEPAKFECHAEYVNQGKGWELFGPMGIYPL